MASTSASSGPYTKPLKALVVALGEVKDFTTGKGEVKQFLQVGLATPEKAFRAFHYDPSKISHIKNGQHVIIRNYVNRNDGNITMNSGTQVYRTAAFDVEEDIVRTANDMINPPEASLVTLKEASTSPVKSSVSVRGYVIQDESPRQVYVGGKATAVRGLTMEDHTGKLRVSLWREKTDTTLKIGDFVNLTNMAISKFNNETTAGTTTRTAIKIMDPPVTPKNIEIEGIMPTDTGYQLISTTAGTYNVTAAILAGHLKIAEENILEEITTLFPWTVDVNTKGMQIASFQTV